MRTRLTAIASITAVALASCASDSGGSSDTTPPESQVESSTSLAGVPEVSADEPLNADRCEANRDAGTITFLTGFDFAAAASIIDVVTADGAGYYEELCLDVEIRSGFSSANYPLVASGQAQFASGGSFSEVVAFSDTNDTRFLATTIEGRSAIDTLIIKAGTATELAELSGATIGVKGKLPPSIDVMMRGAGLVEGDDFSTVPLDGFDPLAHIELDIDGLPGWKSNEVGALDRAGVGVQLFDPLDFGVPGSFGVIFTSAEFAEEHPTAAQDFVRATLRGLSDAVTNPTTAAAEAVKLITENGNPNFLSEEGESFRWETEAALILEGTPEGMGLGVPDGVALQAELDAYAAVGLFGDGDVPNAADFIAGDLASGVYSDSVLIWPGT